MTSDWQALILTLKLASLSTALLLILAIPLAWWIVFYPSRITTIVATASALPLVLPPTVLGFYLLIFLSENSPLSHILNALGIAPLAFTFEGLVIGSMLYSLPFALQALETGFASMGIVPLEAAATLRAKPWERFMFVALPICKNSIFSAAIITFAHTIGEFGVVLMIGGNIPGETRVLSISLFDHVEQMQWAEAHRISFGLVCFAFITLLVLSKLRKTDYARE